MRDASDALRLLGFVRRYIEVTFEASTTASLSDLFGDLAPFFQRGKHRPCFGIAPFSTFRLGGEVVAETLKRLEADEEATVDAAVEATSSTAMEVDTGTDGPVSEKSTNYEFLFTSAQLMDRLLGELTWLVYTAWNAGVREKRFANVSPSLPVLLVSLNADRNTYRDQCFVSAEKWLRLALSLKQVGNSLLPGCALNSMQNFPATEASAERDLHMNIVCKWSVTCWT